MRFFGVSPVDTSAYSSQLLTKESNAKFIFDTVSRAGGISRAQLAKIADLSPSTVSVLTEELIQKHILLEAGTGLSSPTGRKPIMLEVDPSGMQIPCFSFRPTGLLYVLYDLKFNIVEKQLIPYTPDLVSARSSYTSPSNDSIIALFVSALNGSKNLDFSKVRILTVSFYGVFLRDTSMCSSTLGWNLDPSFIDALRARFNNIPVLVSGNTALFAYAEKSLSDSQRDNLLYIHLDDGVGSGIILNGQPIVGECGISGEIGTMLINGRRLDSVVSSAAILECLQKQVGIIDMPTAGNALSLGDEYVTDCLRNVTTHLATAISNALCMVGSMDVHIGGSTAAALGPVFLDMLRGSMQELGYRRVLPHSPILPSKLKDDGDCLGAARAYVDNMFTVILP